MKAISEPKKSEYCAFVDGRDFYVVITTYPEHFQWNAGETWVQVDELKDGNQFRGLVVPSERVHECRNDLEAIREAFRMVRSRMKTCVHYWQDNTNWARAEKGGKRGYHTKHANYWRGRITPAAENWRLCKQIWKEITKL